MRKLAALLFVAAGITATACGEPREPFELDTGWVGGTAFIDRDGDGQVTTGDTPAVGVLAALLLDATGDTIARATTRADGTFAMAEVPAGRYRLVARRGAVGDSVDVLQVDNATITLAANDSVVRIIRLGYPRLTIEAVRALPVGRRVTIEGIALNNWTAFGDSVVHVVDATGAMRAIRTAQSPVQAGDSITVLGTVGLAGGRTVLSDARVNIVVTARGLPRPDSISTLRVATADNGRLADGQARIAGALVLDTVTVGNYRRVGVTDGSGRAELLLHRGIAFTTQSFSPGAIVSVTGVLSPGAAGVWQLKPRSPDDVSATFPRVQIAELRTLAIGSRVFVEGIALNAWTTFGDSTIHVADASGGIRAIRVPAVSVAAGDSVQVLGTIGVSDDRRALVDAVFTVRASARGLPPIDSISTGAAATALAGALADEQARIAGAVIVDTATIAGERILGVNDGSGRVEVVLDAQVVFNTGPYSPGATIAASGVLVPLRNGLGWRLKPRERSELTLSFNTVTVTAARALPLGQQVVLQGLALNALATFADSTLHLMDATGSIRAVRTTGAAAAGDSVRIVGVLALRDGQRVLTNSTVSVLRAGAGLSQPDSISTVRARTADAGALDAALVHIAGSITGSQTLQTGEIVLTVDDGSGSVEVLFDRDVSFAPGPYVPGAMLDAVGVLVPVGTGTWRLKPRAAADVRASYPLVTVAAARALQTGKIVQVRAIALNGWSDFGDASVHLIDSTETIRVVGVPGSLIFRGDSVLIYGIAESLNGQPVLRGLPVPPGPGPGVIRQGVGVPAPDSVGTVTAGTASAGQRDADQVRVRGRIGEVVTAGNDVLLTVNDGSGDVIVRLQPASRFPAASFKVGDTVRVSGLLVPATSGAWELRPRSVDEIAVVGT